MKQAIHRCYESCARHPRWLAGLGLTFAFAFLAISFATGDTAASLAKPTMGFVAWAALSWYIAEHSDGGLDELIGVLGLLLLVFISGAGVVGATLGL
jgi:hypothetical protein